MIIAEMNSPDINALPRDIVVIVPFASCEQHSTHLPVLTDSMIAGEIARRVHERCPDNVLVLPVTWLGYSQHHIRYPGTLSASSETHLAVMMETISCMVKHGFLKILILNSHGGNTGNISVLLQRLMERFGDSGAQFFSRSAWADGSKLNEVRELGGGGSGHSGETETSMILAMRPDLVKTDRLDSDGEREGMRVPGLSSYYRFDQRTRHGGVGDPRPASAEKGERMLDASADEIAAQIPQIRALQPFETK